MNGPARSFTIADQEWFARMSGDRNPVHMSAAFASRTFPGAPMVHGVHALLWAMDQHCAVAPSAKISCVKASFIKPILLGDHVTLGGDDRTLRILVRGEIMAVATFAEPCSRRTAPVSGGPTWQSARVPVDHAGKDLTEAQGEIEITAEGNELSAAFPHLTRVTEPDFAVGLTAISTLVGMTCPGLHSVLSEISVAPAATGRRTLAFCVLRHDHRLNRVELAVEGPGLHGSVAAFTQEILSTAADYTAIRALVTPAEFSGQNPLIIGATGGLGVATARLLTAGGAKPLLGYLDPVLSREVLDSLRKFGECDSTRFDAKVPTEGLKNLAAMHWHGGEVYYFASPRIFRRRIEPYQAEDLRDFLSVFLDAFYETVRGLLEMRAGKPLAIFYPSTEALDEPSSDLFEYKTAKLAGEELCKRLMARYRNLTIISARLPRVKTRQTQAVLKARAEAAEAVMASFVRQVQAVGRTGSPR